VRPEPSRKPEGEERHFAQHCWCGVSHPSDFTVPERKPEGDGHGSGPLPGRDVTVVQTGEKTKFITKPEGDAGQPEAYCSNGACNFKAGHSGLCSWQKADAHAEAERELLEMCNAAAIALRCDGIDALADELLAAVAKYREAK